MSESGASPKAGTRRGALLRVAGLLALFAALAVGHTWPYFKGLDSTSLVREWIVLQSAAETSRRTLLDHQQLPQWDPWRCGGAPHLANPVVDVLSPWVALQAVLGVAPALRLHVYAHLLLAMLGAWWWARRRGLGAVPALGTALSFGLCGAFVSSVAWGHAFLLPAAYLPLLMVAYEAARERLAAAVGAGAVIALMIYEGGFAQAQLAALMLGLRVVVDVAAAPRQAARPLLTLLISAAVAFGLAAPKLIPTLLFAQSLPLPLPKRDALILSQLIDLFLSRDTSHWVKGLTYERYEYFAYMGPLVVLAALWGLWRARQAPFKELYAVAGLLCLLLIGDQGTWFPYHWFAEQAVLRWLIKVPSRLPIGLGLLLALVYGYALDHIERRLGARWPRLPWRYGLLALVLLAAADMVWVAQGQWHHQPFAGDPVQREAGAFSLADGDRASQYRLLMANTGTIRCHQLTPVNISPRLRRGIVPPVWLEQEGAGSVSLERFSPNRLWIDVALERDATLLVNQNWSPGWRATGELPVQVEAVEGLLALRVEAGQGRLVLEYRTPGLLAGLVLGAVTCGVLVVLWALGRRGRRRDPYALDVD